MKHFLAKSSVCFLVMILSLLLVAEFGHAQQIELDKYPSRPITMIYPFGPGGSSDLAVRVICKEAEKFLGRPIVVVNKAGAGGVIGLSAIATAKPDGYTIGNGAIGPLFMASIVENIPYNSLRDFKMIMQFSAMNMGIVVQADSPFQNFKDLIEYGRRNPKKLVFGRGGGTTGLSVTTQYILEKEKVEVTDIPFKSTPETLSGLLGGHIHFGAADFPYSMVEDRQIRVLLLFRDERTLEYPHVPVLKDLGYNFPTPTLLCILGPKGIPEEIVKKLEGAFAKAMKEPAFINGMKELHQPLVYRNSQELADYVTQNYNFLSKLLKEMGVVK